MILLATANPHKVTELRAILIEAPFRVMSLSELSEGQPPEPAETGRTFEENATIKAEAYARYTGLACLADDSGLEVDALGGRPGVISSHYCTEGRDVGMSRAERDHANNARVLAELDGVTFDLRGARFVCVMVFARIASGRRTDGVVEKIVTRGVVEGRIGLRGDVPRGSGGFGYDPLFLVGPDYRRTSAELAPAEKHAISHRGQAGREMAARLRRMTH